MMSLTNTIILHAPATGAAGDPAERERARLAFLSKYQAAVAGRHKRAELFRARPETGSAASEPDHIDADLVATR